MIRKNIFLILAIVCCAIAAFHYGYIFYTADQFHQQEYDIEQADFFGTDAQGKFFNVKADYVVKTGKDRYSLNNIYGRYYLTREKKGYVELLGARGLFEEQKNSLDLSGGVELSLSGGYKVVTDSFQLDMNKRIGYTRDRVTMTGMQGEVVGQSGMTVYLDQKKILLRGPIASTFLTGASGKAALVPSPKIRRSNVPISSSAQHLNVNSNEMEIDYDKSVIDYNGNVVVRGQDGFVLYCDDAKIFYAGQGRMLDGNKLGGGNIRYIEFAGNVTATKEAKLAKGDRGVLDLQQKLMTLTGNVAFKEKDVYLEGDTITYRTDSGVFKLHNEQRSGKTGKSSRRVRINLGSEAETKPATTVK